MNILFVACEWKERSVKRFSGGAAAIFSRAFTQTLLLLLGEGPPPGFLGPIICLISMLLLFSSVYTGFHSWLMKSIKPQIVCSVMGDK